MEPEKLAAITEDVGAAVEVTDQPGGKSLFDYVNVLLNIFIAVCNSPHSNWRLGD